MSFHSKEEQRTWKQNHKKQISEYNKRYHQMHPRNRRNDHLMRQYGITEKQFNEMLDIQGGLCAICTIPMTPGKATHIDHDHETGQVRALLCEHCNRGLGEFYEEPWKLEAAINYLQKGS